METPFQSVQIQWAVGDRFFSSESLNAVYPESDIRWFNYPASVGEAGFSSLKLASGMSLHRSRFKFGTASEPVISGMPAPVATIDVMFREPTLVIQAVLHGRASRRDAVKHGVWCHPYAIDSEQTVVKVESESRFELTLDTSSDIEFIYLHANATSLDLLLGPALAATLLTGVSQHSCPTLNLPAQVLSALRFSFDDYLEGAILKAHAHSKAMEFLTALVRHRAGYRQPARVPKHARAAAIRDHIHACGLNIPNSQTLSHQFGLTPRTLNAAFVDAYGMTVSQYIKEHRLLMAHEELINSHTSIGEIAAKLGYSQLSNFSAAFKSLFGYAPTTLRLKPVPKEI